MHGDFNDAKPVYITIPHVN